MCELTQDKVTLRQDVARFYECKENKKMQRALQLVLYMLIPPLRNNYTNLRLITPDQETLDILKESNSPNYIVVDQGGFVTLVINKFKIDNRSAEVDYDPSTDFRINHPKTQRFELAPEPTLAKFGFDPQRLANILTEYHNLQVTLMGDRNPHRLFFFEIPKEGLVRPVSADGMSTRLARVTERLLLIAAHLYIHNNIMAAQPRAEAPLRHHYRAAHPACTTSTQDLWRRLVWQPAEP